MAKVEVQINQTNQSIELIDRSINVLEQEKIMILNKMRKDELEYSLEEAKASLKKITRPRTGYSSREGRIGQW